MKILKRVEPKYEFNDECRKDRTREKIKHGERRL